MSDPALFKWRHFEAEIIVCAVRWYLRYALSYRDVEELLRERGVSVDHTTVFRGRVPLACGSLRRLRNG
jgi:transposase-like protein